MWEIYDLEGNKCQTQNDTDQAAITFFQQPYYCRTLDYAEDQLWEIQNYPNMFDDDANCTLLKYVLRRKFLRSSNLSRETRALTLMVGQLNYSHIFFDLFQTDLVNLVEESRVQAHVHPLLNSYYISLIPKNLISHYFPDFHPISLCNLVYKIIPKTIANHLRLTLSSFITSHQFGFLKNRQIHVVVAIAQECLHFIHSKNLNAAIMKVNLRKEFDCLDWDYLCLVLHKVHIQSLFAKWIMACISNAQYVIIINGYPTNFFKAERGLRQSCSLFPSALFWHSMV